MPPLPRVCLCADPLFESQVVTRMSRLFTSPRLLPQSQSQSQPLAYTNASPSPRDSPDDPQYDTEGEEQEQEEDGQAAHPGDGFSVLRFSVGLPWHHGQGHVNGAVDDGNEDDGDGDGDDYHVDSAVQPIELCFHSSFVPSLDRPISLHLSGRRHHHHVVWYPAPPSLSTPTPPCYIIECHGVVRIMPPSLASTASASSAFPARPINAHAVDHDSSSSGAHPIPLFSCVTAVIAVVAVALSVTLSSALFRYEPNVSTDCLPSIPTALNETQLLAAVASAATHSTTAIRLPQEVLSVAADWSQIPWHLVGLGRPFHTLDVDAYGDADPYADSRLIGDFSKIAPLDELRDAAHQVYEAVYALPDYNPDVKHNIRPVFNQILDSINHVSADWTHLEYYQGFAWIPRLIDSARQLHDKLQTIAVHDDNEDALFFKPPPSPIDSATTDALFRYRRRQLEIVDGELVVANGSGSATHVSVLDAYNNAFAHVIGDSSDCSFFRSCVMRNKHHAWCHVPSTSLPRPRQDNSRAALRFLERWDLDSHEKASIQQHNVQDDGEPMVVALSRHLTALGSQMDRLFVALSELGLFQEHQPTNTTTPDSSNTHWVWFRRRRQLAVNMQQRKRAADAASRLVMLRNAALFTQELAAVRAAATARNVCSRLDRLNDAAIALGSGRGWVHLLHRWGDDDSDISDDTERSRGSAGRDFGTVVIHSLLDRPEVLADEAKALGDRLEEADARIGLLQRRLLGAQRREAESKVQRLQREDEEGIREPSRDGTAS